MKTERSILAAFLLNLAFSIFEFVGGILTGSVAILSDAVHDIGDAASIGLSFFLEKKSKRSPDGKYTYGYARFSAVGSLITTLVLLFGSGVMIYNAIGQIIAPTRIHYDGMILFAIVGVCVNFLAALLTQGGGSLNQRAVNLHMLEDVLGWVVVLIGGIVMRFTGILLLDSILSMGVSVFILFRALQNLKKILDLFLEKVPCDMDIARLQSQVEGIDGVTDVHHIHLWSMDGQHSFATMHIVTDRNGHEMKEKIRKALQVYGITHVTLELEKSNEDCRERQCSGIQHNCCAHGHHHHHGH